MRPPHALDDGHVLSRFACGVAELDAWLAEQARRAQRAGTARTGVWAAPEDRSVTLHGQRLGSLLLLDALRTVVDASDAAGERSVVVDAIDEAAARFYERHDVRRVGSTSRLVMKVATAHQALEAGGSWCRAGAAAGHRQTSHTKQLNKHTWCMTLANRLTLGRRPARAVGAALLVSALLAAGSTSQATAAPSTTDTTHTTDTTASSYERTMLADRPTMMLSGAGRSGRVRDAVSPSRGVSVHGRYEPTRTPDGGTGLDLDGRSGYVAVAGSRDLSIATTGRLTVELLVRPDRLRSMRATASSGDGPMVHLLQKGNRYGVSGDQEYVLRFYDADAQRPNRLSAYAFNPAGGLGAGSFFQDRLRSHGWIHVTAVYDTRARGSDGWGTVRIYRDGVLRDVDSLGERYRVRPADTGSPLFIGGNPDHSFFDGAIGAVAVYPTALSPERVSAHATAALGRQPSGAAPVIERGPGGNDTP